MRMKCPRRTTDRRAGAFANVWRTAGGVIAGENEGDIGGDEDGIVIEPFPIVIHGEDVVFAVDGHRNRFQSVTGMPDHSKSVRGRLLKITRTGRPKSHRQGKRG